VNPRPALEVLEREIERAREREGRESLACAKSRNLNLVTERTEMYLKHSTNLI
jgi:hypothetical protein